MDEKFTKLTSAVYKLLEYFPESDPLKTRAKEKALAIMDALALNSSINGWASFQADRHQIQITEDINSLLSYLKIAKDQGWISSVNYFIISNEYEKIKKCIEPLFVELTKKLPGIEMPDGLKKEPKEHTNPVLNEYNISARQKKILELLEQKESAQVMDLQAVLPDVTKRTIRRDLDELLEIGKISRLGEFNQVSYKIAR